MYGGLLGVLFFMCRDLLPHPYGLLFFFGLNAVQLLRGGVLVLNRMRLPYAALSMFLGAIWFLCAAGFTLAGFTLETLPIPAMLVGGALAIAGAVVLHLEAWANPERWRAWGVYMEDVSLLDMVLGNHIPDLREATEGQRPT